jgi:hypothetical protein
MHDAGSAVDGTKREESSAQALLQGLLHFLKSFHPFFDRGNRGPTLFQKSIYRSKKPLF